MFNEKKHQFQGLKHRGGFQKWRYPQIIHIFIGFYHVLPLTIQLLGYLPPVAAPCSPMTPRKGRRSVGKPRPVATSVRRWQAGHVRKCWNPINK